MPHPSPRPATPGLATQRTLDHLEAVAAIAGPASYLRASIHPALDSLHEQSRWLALKGSSERWGEGW